MNLVIENITQKNKYSYIIVFILMSIILGIYTIDLPPITINFLFLFVCTTFLIFKQYDIILFIFIVLFPTNGFVNTEYNILGILNSKYIISIFALFVGILKDKEIKNNYHFDKLAQYGFSFIVFASIYLVIQDFKIEQLGIQDVSIMKHITGFIKKSVDVIVFYYIIKFSNLTYYKLYFQKAFFVSLLIISISLIFSDVLYEIGVYMGDEERIKIGVENQRLGGVWGRLAGGDVNSLGGFLVMGISCVLFSSKRHPWLLIILIVFGIMLTGSRTAFVNLIIVILAFLLFSKESIGIKLRNIFLVSILGLILFQIGIFDFVIERMMLLVTGKDEGLDADGIGRLSGWFFYLDYITSDLKIFFFGASENIYDVVYSKFVVNRVAHNFYLQLWYFCGIFAVIIFLYLSVMLNVCILRSENKYQVFLILPAFTTLFTISEVSVVYFIPIVLSLCTDYRFDFNQKKYVYKK